jgi:uncharacterized membrane protein
MKPNANALIGALAALAAVLIVALAYLVSVDKTGAPQVATFGTALTTIIGALVALIATNRGNGGGQS